MRFGTYHLPLAKWYYTSHIGLSLNGRLTPLFSYPVEVLALCRTYRTERGVILGSGKAVLYIPPPPRHPSLSLQEFYALYAEKILRAAGKMRAAEPKDPSVKRFFRNLEVLRFMRATWDALLIGYQTERIFCLTRYGTYILNSVKLQGVNRFRAQLISHPVEAARRLKQCAADNRLWYYGGPQPSGRLLRVAERRCGLLVSYLARGLPPAPPDPEGLPGLLSRLTSEPPPVHPKWAGFVKAYITRFRNPTPCDLYTMPSPSGAFGLSRDNGGHNTGIQHLVLLGYALTKIHGVADPLGKPYGDPARDDGSFLELLSQSLHPNKGKRSGPAGLFNRRWEELEEDLPGTTAFLQAYLRKGVFYVLDNIEHVPILPIEAEEKGLKTRYPTCSLTAVNLVQQILRRALDAVMIRDPRCAGALGGTGGIDMRGESGPWEAQDATAATDYHPQWLTEAPYRELARLDSRLQPYVKYFNKLFGPKKILLGSQCDYEPVGLLTRYPAAPLLQDEPLADSDYLMRQLRTDYGHARVILSLWDGYIGEINSYQGVITSTGQMMGDPTSFPVLMLVSIFGGELALAQHPYTREERARKYPGLSRKEFIAELVGDDANIPRWTKERSDVYHTEITSCGMRISWAKTFRHKKYGLIAEVPTEHGVKLPHYPLSTLVAPPGGSKGSVHWHNQPAALAGDPDIPQYRFTDYFLKKSPYYYSWRLAYKMGLPLAAPPGHGGIGLPMFPKASTTHQVEWLRHLSTLPLDKLISGTALSIGRSPSSLMAGAMSQWLEGVIKTHQELESIGGLLSDNPLDDSGQNRLSLSDAYRGSLSTVRSAEFYFRAPPETLVDSAPSITVAASRFQRKVSKTPWFDKQGGWSYQDTKRDLERKTVKFFSRPGAFMHYAGEQPKTAFGLEQTSVVRVRYKAPHLTGIG